MKKILAIFYLIMVLALTIGTGVSISQASSDYHPPDKTFESISVFSEWFYNNYHPVGNSCYDLAKNLQKVAHLQGYMMDIEILDDAEYYFGFKKHLPEGENHAVVSVAIGKELIFASPLLGKMWVGTRLP